jgi:hypothetical protein
VELLEVGNWSIIREDGPVWFRGFAFWTEEEAASKLEQLTGVLQPGQTVRFNKDGGESVINPNASADVQRMQKPEAGE